MVYIFNEEKTVTESFESLDGIFKRMKILNFQIFSPGFSPAHHRPHPSSEH